MGILEKMMNVLTQFLSNKYNLFALQCVLYFIVGYILAGVFPIQSIVLLYVLLMILQLTTYIRGCSDGIKFSESTHLYNEHMTNEYKKLLKKYNSIKGRKK